MFSSGAPSHPAGMLPSLYSQLIFLAVASCSQIYLRVFQSFASLCFCADTPEYLRRRLEKLRLESAEQIQSLKQSTEESVEHLKQDLKQSKKNGRTPQTRPQTIDRRIGRTDSVPQTIDRRIGRTPQTRPHKTIRVCSAHACFLFGHLYLFSFLK